VLLLGQLTIGASLKIASKIIVRFMTNLLEKFTPVKLVSGRNLAVFVDG
jgi:hypothetical protein